MSANVDLADLYVVLLWCDTDPERWSPDAVAAWERVAGIVSAEHLGPLGYGPEGLDEVRAVLGRRWGMGPDDEDLDG